MTDEQTADELDALELAGFAPYLMNRIMHRYNQSMQGKIAHMGLTVPKMRALAALAAQGSLTLNDLCVFAVAEQSTMSRTVDQMERDGLIRREVSSEDSRVRVVSLTEQGRGVYDSVWPEMQSAQRALLEGLDPRACATFLTTLNTILRNIRVNEI